MKYLADFLRDTITNDDDPIQGSVTVHLADGSTLTGRVVEVTEDGAAIWIERLIPRANPNAAPALADAPQLVVTAYIVRTYHHRAGA